MNIVINRDEEYSLNDLEKTIAEKKIADGAVINHMPYNSGLFFDKIESDETFYKKSLENDMKFADEIFG